MARRRNMDRIFKSLASIRSHNKVAIDSSTIEAKKGELIGYDGFKHKKDSKIHAILNEHDSKKFNELFKELNKIQEEFYGRKLKQYNIEIYKKMRSAIEKFFGWIKYFRKIIIRYERSASVSKNLVSI